MWQEIELTRKVKDKETKETIEETYIVRLETDKIYDGGKDISDEEKDIRKVIGLPITKQLIYYPNPSDPTSVKKVIQYQLTQMYDITDRWYTIRIKTEDGKETNIHSSFLIEMQRPSFIDDYQKEQKTI